MCPKKTVPAKAKDVYAEHAHIVAERDLTKIPVEQAAQWLMQKAFQYYLLVRETWGADKKYCKTPRNFFAEQIYDEDPALWDWSKPANGGKQNRKHVQRSNALRAPLSGVFETPRDQGSDGQVNEGTGQADNPSRFADRKDLEDPGDVGRGVRETS